MSSLHMCIGYVVFPSQMEAGEGAMTAISQLQQEKVSISAHRPCFVCLLVCII